LGKSYLDSCLFLDKNDNLILGDFGLVFFSDEDKTRISETFENVGSRDWMPSWASGVRLEEVRPTFDVFSLGKLLWSLVTGKPKLLLWYYDKPVNNIEKLFPNDPIAKFINPLLKRCIVENEQDCLPNALVLRDEIDKLLEILKNDIDYLDLKNERKCKVCGIGKYQLVVNENRIDTDNFGLRVVGNRKWKIFTCSHCGNVQFFSFEEQIPKAWQK
jgi:hypothetical protein